jgi:hypothetical protein
LVDSQARRLAALKRSNGAEKPAVSSNSNVGAQVASTAPVNVQEDPERERKLKELRQKMQKHLGNEVPSVPKPSVSNAGAEARSPVQGAAVAGQPKLTQQQQYQQQQKEQMGLMAEQMRQRRQQQRELQNKFEEQVWVRMNF